MASAQALGSRLLWALIILAVLSIFRSAFAQTSTEMRFYSDSFISPAFEATQKSNYEFVGVNLKTESLSQDILRMDISGGLAIGTPLLNYLNMTELYFKSSQNLSENFYIGRKKMQWSELDSKWNFGVWQPIFKWNPLASEEQGLSGLFWEIDKPFYTLVLFVSPLYLPSQGPSFEIKDGGFTKGNPWFHQPPQSVRIWDEATDMQYHFERPNDGQIVLQNSYGAKLSMSGVPDFRMQVSYLYGPDNVLAIGYRGSFDLANMKGRVELQPQVFFHSVAGLDLSYKMAQFKVGMSGIYDHPIKEKIFDKVWSQPLFEDAFLLSPLIEWDNGMWSVGLMHLDVFGGVVHEEGANLANKPLTNLYPFQQADRVSVGLNINIGRSEKILFNTSYTHSSRNDFDLVKVNTKYRFANVWSLFSEAQILRAGATHKDNVNEIAEFANNDRLMLGVSYDL